MTFSCSNALLALSYTLKHRHVDGSHSACMKNETHTTSVYISPCHPEGWYLFNFCKYVFCRLMPLKKQHGYERVLLESRDQSVVVRLICWS